MNKNSEEAISWYAARIQELEHVLIMVWNSIDRVNHPAATAIAAAILNHRDKSEFEKSIT